MRITLGGSFIRKHFGLIFGGIWLLVGIPFVIGGIATWQQEKRFAETAESVEGMVLTRDIRRGRRSSDSGSRSTQYRVTYRFQGPDGVTREKQSDVNVYLWEQLTERGPIAIQYLADDPSSHRIARGTDWVQPAVFGGLGGVFTIAGGIICFVSITRRVGRSRLLRSGTHTNATVSAVGPTNFRINGVTQWRVSYRYEDPLGREYRGKSPYLSPDGGEIWKEGDSANIMFDPQRPSKSLWIGKA